MEKVLVTGGKGRIGAIIFEALKDVFDFTLVDCESRNIETIVRQINVASSYEELKEIIQGKDVVIHLAWNSRENWKSNSMEPENKKMAENVYRAAMETGVPRVIMASSIHADNFSHWHVPSPVTPNKIPIPNNLYGTTKVYIETLGRYYATKGLEVICIRFGGVSLDDKLRNEEGYEKFWLSRRDCASLVKRCIEVKRIPFGFELVYGVSNNANRIHDWENNLDWIPVDDSSKMVK